MKEKENADLRNARQAQGEWRTILGGQHGKKNHLFGEGGEETMSMRKREEEEEQPVQNARYKET